VLGNDNNRPDIVSIATTFPDGRICGGGPLPVLHVSVSSPLSPHEALERLTDFSPARAENWAGVDDSNLTVHDHGDGWAEVTEGNKIGWERERYTWDAAAGTVSAVTVKSNIWATGSGWNYTIMPDGTGSRVEVTAVRNGYGVKGKLVGALLSLVGKRLIISSTTAALADR
jgi:hypothetical protein